MPRRRLLSVFLAIAYLSAGYQLIRFYVSFPFFYLHLPQYFAGTERLPFQRRVFPIPFLRALGENRFVQNYAATRVGYLHNPWRMSFFIFSLVFFAITCALTLRLYRVLSTSRRLEFLVIPLIFYTFTWTYVLNVDQHYTYPYDIPSLAFFSAGLLFIYQRRFLPLALTILIGTLNREVTLFLIGIYILDAASIPSLPSAHFRQRFNRRQIPWARVALLSLLWFAVYAMLAIHFRWNDRSEDYSRVTENLQRIFLKPFYWPQILNISGYLLPFVCLFRARLLPQRFANYLYILVPWFGIMFYSGILNETRIYGELSTYTAVAAVLIAEQYLDSLAAGRDRAANHLAEPSAPLAGSTPHLQP